jgi:hypothetical protein
MSHAVYPPWVPSPTIFTTSTDTRLLEISSRTASNRSTVPSIGMPRTEYEATTRNGSSPRCSTSV